MSSRKIVCVISGKSYTFAKDYFQKKVEEYVRNILDVRGDKELSDSDSEEVKSMIEFHRVRNKGKNKRVSNTLNFATLKSDADVAAFINTISQYED